MSTDNVTDRLLTDARKKTARQESPSLARAAMVAGIVAVLVSWAIPLAGWLLGLIALVLGTVAVRRPAPAKQAKIALVLGFAALVIGTFVFTLGIAMRWY